MCTQGFSSPLSTDWNHLQRVTTRPLEGHLRKSLKKTVQRSQRTCGNDIRYKVKSMDFVILKIATVQPYLLADQDHLPPATTRQHVTTTPLGDTSHKFRKKSDQRFLRCANRKNQRLIVDISLDGLEPFSAYNN